MQPPSCQSRAVPAVPSLLPSCTAAELGQPRERGDPQPAPWEGPAGCCLCLPRPGPGLIVTQVLVCGVSLAHDAAAALRCRSENAAALGTRGLPPRPGLGGGPEELSRV